MNDFFSLDSELADNVWRALDSGWFYPEKDPLPSDIDWFADLSSGEVRARWNSRIPKIEENPQFIDFLRSTHFTITDEGEVSLFRISDGKSYMFVSARFIMSLFGFDITEGRYDENEMDPITCVMKEHLDSKAIHRYQKQQEKSEQTGPANPRPFGTSGMSPADSASRAGDTPEASGDS